MTIRVGISGFGRINRNFFRAILEQDTDIGIVVVNDLTDTRTLTHPFKHDSVLGRFGGEVFYDESSTVVDGRAVKVLAQHNPTGFLWGELDIDVVVESTGFFTDGEKAKAHLEAGAEKVVVFAPVENVDGTFVMGVNEGDYDDETTNIVSNALCTTNCLAPLAKVLHASSGIVRGIMTTIHSHTGDQRVFDAPHSDLCHARAAALNMILTKTGATQAVVPVLPELKGKFDGPAVCVPTPASSLTDLILQTEKEVSVKAVSATVKAAAEGKLKSILEYTENPIAPTDIAGDPHSPIFDVGETKVTGDLMKVLSWYDSEWGYSDHLVQLTVPVGLKLA